MTFECNICLESFPAGESETLSCNHSYCRDCIGKWRKAGANSCPMCRDESKIVRIYCREDSIESTLLICKLEKEFGSRICEPISVYLANPITKSLSIWVLWMVPQTLLPELDPFFWEFDLVRIQKAPTGASNHVSSISEGEHSVSFVLNRVVEVSSANSTTSGVSSASPAVKKLRNLVRGLLFKDARLALMQRNNSSAAAKRLFPMFSRMLEFEVAIGWQQNQTDNESLVQKQAAQLVDSEIYKSIHQDSLSEPFEILQRFGADWIRIAAKLPRAEVEHVARATKNLHLTTKKAESNHATIETGDNEARSIVLWQRFRNPLCACCWRRDETLQFKCCSLCECTLYCSEECREADWKTHANWCCNPDAHRVRGALEMTLSAPEYTSAVSYSGSAPTGASGSFQFTEQFLEQALDAPH